MAPGCLPVEGIPVMSWYLRFAALGYLLGTPDTGQARGELMRKCLSTGAMI